MDLKQFIRDIPDFPVEGVLFKDITPLILDIDAFACAVTSIGNEWMESVLPHNIDAIVALDARGFIFGSALAFYYSIPLAIARKKGKLPSKCVSQEYDLEYGKATLELHSDALSPEMRALVIDDLLATGGTAHAACQLIEKLGAVVAGCAFVIELKALKGRELLKNYEVQSLIQYD